ncbi:MAG: hypothetical protein EOS63_23860 [Mesorhizobium sp.]|uniref:hypothetical protein n=1 Tax=Mesorhizobium sp. TaxID=1871066 RepID=UPI000FE6D8B3|nr:hypothetical protein [Mesorhizobium sp.]RWE75441.1 MAG: hypothetical protein EOS63_23860 [Mesorhizobium sp.]TJW61008.1 MAG: hypothetical protein E5V97_22085 [Mesorhizobium sp.]
MAKAGRVACCVPFCRRTIAHAKLQAAHGLDGIEANEWICGNHWRNVSTLVRRLYSIRKRHYRELLSAERPAYVRHVNHIWSVCRKQAIERAAGI